MTLWAQLMGKCVVGYSEVMREQLLLLTFEVFKKRNVKHFISTRYGGVSNGVWESLNIGLRTGDDPLNVLENRRRLWKEVGCQESSIFFMNQVHGNRVVTITSVECKGGGKSRIVGNADGMVTDKKECMLVVVTADCVPVLFHDPVRQVIAVAHAGWKGILSGIIQNVLQCMKTSYKVMLSNVRLGIGPCIRACCYEVRKNVAEQFRAVHYNRDISGVSDSFMVDLPGEIRAIASGMGVLERNMEDMNLCTKCHGDIFYSYRESRKTGRFAAGISLCGND